jgi:hypothetical protein
MAPVKTVTVTLDKRTPKKSVVRFDATDENSILSSLYLDNAADTKLGSPESIKVTITKGE